MQSTSDASDESDPTRDGEASGDSGHGTSAAAAAADEAETIVFSPESLDPDATVVASGEAPPPSRSASGSAGRPSGHRVPSAGARREPPPYLGPYRIDRKLGAGGMGAVYQATLREPRGSLPAGARVALKIVHPHLLRQAGTFERFRREALVGRSVEHPNVVRTVDADSYDHLGTEFHYIALDYVEGQTLADLLLERGELPERLCRHIGAEVASGLVAIHAEHVVHRDIKPGNVMIAADERVHILDLGLAKLIDASVLLTAPGQFAGSLLYAAPEQFGSADVGPPADLYGLGVLLYQLASGVRPHTATDYAAIVTQVLNEEPRRLREVSPQVSPFMDAVVHALLNKRPIARLGPARVVAETLAGGEESVWWRRRGS